MADGDSAGAQDQGHGQDGDSAGQQDGGQQGSQGDGGKPETDWKAKARMWEDRAKANSAAARKLADLEAANQTDLERAQAAAKAAEDRAAALGQRAAASDIRSILVDLGYPAAHASALIEDMNVSRYVGDGGDVDAEAVKAKYGPLVPPSGPRSPAPNPAQGNGSAAKSLGELIADAEKSRNPAQSLRLKSQQLAQMRNKG